MTRGALIFWCLVVGLIAWDYQTSPEPYRVEPPAFALGSGEISIGGHCSGR